MPALTPVEVERFWSHVASTPEDPRGCTRVWDGYLNPKGYGQFSVGGREYKAHRVSARLSGLDIDGLVVRHACDNPKCVTPEHLVTGTTADNNADMVQRGRLRGIAAEGAMRTHCPKGHPYDEENTRMTRRGSRECRTCDRARCRARRMAAKGGGDGE